tara:strand:+ start:26 stop:541 length:516 start_codon:yes stop_codon:yes gene_type:complete
MFNNPNQAMYNARGSTASMWGKDSTGLVKYTFDRYGFRNHNDYSTTPDYVFFGSSLLFGVGVDKNDVFTNEFNCWNFGLAGKYNERQILDCYEKFKNLQIDCKIIFVWRASHPVPDIDFGDQNTIYHCLPYKTPQKNHVRLLDYVDYDVSGTHWGVKTHQKFHKMLSYLLK